MKLITHEKTILWGLVALVLGLFFAKFLVGNPVSGLLILKWGNTTKGYITSSDDWWNDGDAVSGYSHEIVCEYSVAGKNYQSKFKGDGQLKSDFIVDEEPIPIEIEYFTEYPAISRLKGNGAQSLFEWFWREFCLGLFVYAMICATGVQMTRLGLKERREYIEKANKVRTYSLE